MPEVTLISSQVLSPGTHQFPEFAVPVNIQKIRFEIDCSVFTVAGASITVVVEESLNGGGVWKHLCQAVRPSGVFLDLDGTTSTALKTSFTLGQPGSTTRRLRGRLVLVGLSFTMAAKIVF